jgi:hypothetical protein
MENMAILKKIVGNELYLYMNGNLIYKRWLDVGYSKVFDLMAYDKYTLSSYRDLEYDKSNRFLSINARIKLKTTEDGGRQSGFKSGYRPNHVFELADDSRNNCTYIGEIIFEGKPLIEPGEEREVTVRFLVHQPIEKYLNKGRIWWIFEGPKQVAQAEMI